MKRLILPAAAMAVAVMLNLHAAAAQGPQRYAVVIGVGGYDDAAYPALAFAEKDAQIIRDALIDPNVCKFPKENVKLLLGKEATTENIKLALMGLQRATKDDMVIVAYIGAVAAEDGEVYWLPPAAKSKVLAATAVSVAEIGKFLCRSDSARQLVLMDCWLGGAKGDDVSAIFADLATPGRITVIEPAKAVDAMKSGDGDVSDLSSFLAQGLRGSADGDADGMITTDELWRYLSDRVAKAAAGRKDLRKLERIAVRPTPEFAITGESLWSAAAVKDDKAVALDLGGGLKMKFALIPAGKFLMGTARGTVDGAEAEYPQREVTLTKPFYLAQTKVTQAQWQNMMGTTIALQRDKAEPAWLLYGQGDDYPMYYVSWEDAMDFCRALSKKTGKKITLPTEAQWEYAARAGSKDNYSFGNDANELGKYAWYAENSDGKTHPVARKKPNAFGLYDMGGDLEEWVLDWYAPNYEGADSVDPQGPKSSWGRVLRGGEWNRSAWFCRPAARDKNQAGMRTRNYGFRVLMEAE